MQRTDWNGVMPAITNPYESDLSIDHRRLADQVTRLADAGCTGIVTPGSLGEGGALSLDEKVAIWTKYGTNLMLESRPPCRPPEHDHQGAILLCGHIAETWGCCGGRCGHRWTLGGNGGHARTPCESAEKLSLYAKRTRSSLRS